MRRTSSGIAGMAAIIATILVAGSTIAGQFDTWGDKQTLRNAPNVDLQDAAFSGSRIVVVWQESGPEIWLRRSDSAGPPYAPRARVARSARQAEVDICGDDVYVAYAKRPIDVWRIQVSKTSVGQGGFDAMPVSSGIDDARDPDVACAGGRLFVSWVERIAGDRHMIVDHTLRNGGTFPTAPMDVGEEGDDPVMAGVNDRAYLVAPVSTGGFAPDLMFHRWSVAGAPGHAVVYLGSMKIGAGYEAVIAAAGDTVVVAWFAPIGALRARVSHDRGATWDPIRQIQPRGGGSIQDASYVPRNLVIKGSRIVLAFALQGCSFVPGGGCGSTEYMASTTDAFVDFTRVRLSNTSTSLTGDLGDVRLGFVAGPVGPRLAAAVDDGSRIRALLQ